MNVFRRNLRPSASLLWTLTLAMVCTLGINAAGSNQSNKTRPQQKVSTHKAAVKRTTTAVDSAAYVAAQIAEMEARQAEHEREQKAREEAARKQLEYINQQNEAATKQ